MITSIGSKKHYRQVRKIHPAQGVTQIWTDEGQQQSSTQQDPIEAKVKEPFQLRKAWQEFQRQKCIYKFVVFLEWTLFIGFGIIVFYYAEEVWKGYQAKEVSIKVSKKKLEFMVHPTVTLW